MNQGRKSLSLGTTGQALSDIPPRTIGLVLCGAAAIAVALVYSLVLRKDIDQLRLLRLAQPQAEASTATNLATDSLFAQLQTEVDSLREELTGDHDLTSSSQLVSQVIRTLDDIATQQGVRLLSVKPGNRSDIFDFVETPFDVEVEGGFAELHSWLQVAEQRLKPMVVKRIDLSRLDRAALVSMRIRVVSYRVRAS